MKHFLITLLVVILPLDGSCHGNHRHLEESHHHLRHEQVRDEYHYHADNFNEDIVLQEEGSTSLNLRPIIGVFTQSMDFKPHDVMFPPNADIDSETEYISASYVKLIEAAGARVVAIRFNQPKEALLQLFSKLNGVLLPGGGVNLVPGTPFYQAGEALYEYVLEHEDFPLLGICLGMEWISALAAGSRGVLDDSGRFNSSNVAYNLELTKEAYKSTLFKDILKIKKLEDAMKHGKITFNEHQDGVTPESFMKYEKLGKNYNILATSKDGNGKQFVAAFEHKVRNIFSVQFHPEKAIFEWFETANFPHSPEAILFSQMIANMFMSKARLNKNSFKLDAVSESKALIQNHQKLFLGGGSYFLEAYVFYRDEPQGVLNQANQPEPQPYRTIIV